MADMERRVYALSTLLLAEVKAYQKRQGIVSETEAIRQLLGRALQDSDTADTLVEKLSAEHRKERDLRRLAAKVLGAHPLIRSIVFAQDYIEFEMRCGTKARYPQVQANG